VISTSKIRKITAIRKNRSENGIRAELNGENPHSKAEDFSRSLLVLYLIVDAMVIKIIEMIIINVNDIRVNDIYFSYLIFLIGNQMYNYILKIYLPHQ
jgi:hypothetical protein